MGRGLSDLQRWMLRRAAEKPDCTDNGGCELLVGRVIAEHFEVTPALWPSQQNEDGTAMPLTLRGPVFKDHAKEAATARAAIVRAMNRLEERGLAERLSGAYSRWSGMSLTNEGKSLVVSWATDD